MATVNLTHEVAQPAPARKLEGIPPFWSSLFAATPANDEHADEGAAVHPAEKPASIVGGLWIQIR